MARTTQQVFDSHEAAFQSRDMARMMSVYAGGAVLLLRNNVVVG